MAADNKIIDYISGIEVNATPEETEAVQVFSKQLVEDYGYSKQQIQTRPQYRVKSRPSDTKGRKKADGFHFNVKNENYLANCKPPLLNKLINLISTR